MRSVPSRDILAIQLVRAEFHLPVELKEMLSDVYVLLFQELLDNGANAAVTTYKNETVLGRATRIGHHEVITYLINNKHCNPNKPCQGDNTPVMVALNNSDLETLQVLAHCGAVIPNTCLPLVASKGKLDLWLYVCRQVEKVNINVKDNKGQTALYHACHFGYDDIVDDIIKRGILFIRALDILSNARGRF